VAQESFIVPKYIVSNPEHVERFCALSESSKVPILTKVEKERVHRFGQLEAYFSLQLQRCNCPVQLWRTASKNGHGSSVVCKFTQKNGYDKSGELEVKRLIKSLAMIVHGT
jgi:hypothetical protein